MEVPTRFFTKKVITGLLIIFTFCTTVFFSYKIDFYERLRGVQTDELYPYDCLNPPGRFMVFSSNHRCPRLLAESYCYDELPVPNLVHYVILNTKQFYFYNLLSVLSSYRILKPCFIFIHGNVIPDGKWWDHLLELVPNIIFIKTDAPSKIFHNKLDVVQHKSDVIRLRVMMEYGGIYMDTDQIALKSFDPLRKYQMTLAKGNSQSVGNAVIIGVRRAMFLRIWYLSYITFNDKQWGFHSCVLPFKLSRILPKLVHLEGINTFFGFEKSIYYIFQGVCDWSHRYALHLYYSLQRKNKKVTDFSPEEIKGLNTTFGEVARFIYFGQLPGKRKTNC